MSLVAVWAIAAIDTTANIAAERSFLIVIPLVD
jgi:hypothetical protein